MPKCVFAYIGIYHCHEFARKHLLHAARKSMVEIYGSCGFAPRLNNNAESNEQMTGRGTSPLLLL